MKLLEAMKTWWTEATPLARALLVTGGTALVVALGYFASQGPTDDHAPLYTRLSTADAAEVVESLRAKKVPYRLADGGSTILVSRAQLYDLRLEMASSGLPKGGGVGFEIFDQSSILMTDFTQKVNYRRAMQGELARTIAQLPQVESARVHLAIPESSLFSRDKKEPSASVYLKLLPGRTLSPKQIAGIAHLTSSSVENLQVERVAVLDGDGRLLGDAPSSDGAALSSRALNITHDYETRLEKRVVELLEPVVGAGRVVARISADLDLSRSEETSEQYDAENTAVRTERKQQEKSNSLRRDAGGLAGTPGNLPQAAGQAGGAGFAGNTSNSDRASTETDYAVPKVVRHTERPVGEVRRLSVAVLVDSGSMGGDTQAGAELVVPSGAERRGPAALQPSTTALAELVKRSVGFQAERGDQIEVVYLPFSAKVAPAEASEATAATASLASLAVPPGAPLAAAFLLGFGMIALAIRSAGKKRAAQLVEAQRQQEEDEARAALEAQSRDTAKRATKLRDEVQTLATANTGAAVEVLKTWITNAPSRGA